MAQEIVGELNLLVNILDRLSRCPDGIRTDQVKPVIERLAAASEKLQKIESEIPVKRFTRDDHSNRQGNAAHNMGNLDMSGMGSSKQGRSSVFSSGLSGMSLPASKPVVTKPSSIKAIPIPRNKPPSDTVKISKEVAQCITSTLYNILEGTASLLRAARCNIFIRQNDEMVSIVNVSKKLTFPPQLLRHRCVGSSDAEVLGSGIALNQRVSDGSQSSASMLIFPIFAMSNTHERKSQPIAVIHVENKLQGMASFDEMDESMLYYSTCLIGELMARVPQMDWINNFYDPITQHIVCPFKPAAILTLPSLNRLSSSHADGAAKKDKRATIHNPPVMTLSTENTKDGSSPLNAAVVNEIENCITKLLIKRESLPETAKQPTVGMVQMPTLREVRSFLDNIEECWKESVTASVALTESDREVQMEVRKLRFALEEAQKQNREAAEKLRLYELGSMDYQQEYKEMKCEFEMYLRKQENLDI
eukprot:gene4983-3578_t